MSSWIGDRPEQIRLTEQLEQAVAAGDLARAIALAEEKRKLARLVVIPPLPAPPAEPGELRPLPTWHLGDPEGQAVLARIGLTDELAFQLVHEFGPTEVRRQVWLYERRHPQGQDGCPATGSRRRVYARLRRYCQQRLGEPTTGPVGPRRNP